jgi:hypothetical protein
LSIEQFEGSTNLQFQTFTPRSSLNGQTGGSELEGVTQRERERHAQLVNHIKVSEYEIWRQGKSKSLVRRYVATNHHHDVQPVMRVVENLPQRLFNQMPHLKVHKAVTLWHLNKPVRWRAMRRRRRRLANLFVCR